MLRLGSDPAGIPRNPKWTPGEILCLASKPFPVDGLCTRPNDDNLSDESPLIPEIDCKLKLDLVATPSFVETDLILVDFLGAIVTKTVTAC